MKKLMLSFLVISLSSFSFGQMHFGVSPGISLSGAHFGYKFNKIVPFISLQNASGSFTYMDKATDYDYDLDKVVTHTYTEKYSAGVLMPSIGVKYFIKEQGKLKAFGEISLSKPLLRAKAIYDGVEDKDVADAIKELSIFGGELSVGVEYFFDDNFSVGGSYGLRFFSMKVKDTYETEYYDPNTGNYVPTTDEYEFKGNFSPTFSKLSLNFYF